MSQTVSAMVGRLPRAPGAYRFRDAAGHVLYIGRATELRRRVASYWSDLRDRGHLTPMVTRVTSIEAVACDSGHEAAWLERNLLGPYLGGRRVRQAVKGLSRCLPLALTATGLRGAEREMARARGVTQADRASFADTIGGVLRREPIAVGHVRAQLGQLRDDAARVLAFELAADVNAEIQALEWVTCPQRAASLERTDFAACGWSDGIITSFAVRAGQISEWVQASCPESDAAPLLAGTPPGWAEFAQRNAELAAALHASRLLLLSGDARH